MKRRIAGWMALLLLPALAHANCFNGQLPQPEWGQAAAASSLRLVLMQPNGQPFGAASGVVVASSGTSRDPGNRVLTAGHVVREVARVPGAWLAAWSSDGVFLGRLETVAEASPGPASRLSAHNVPGGLRSGDAAVLRMAAPSPDGARLYPAIPGLRLAQRQPTGLLVGEFRTPAGIDPGASGAGAIASDGTLLGVTAFKAIDRTASRVQLLEPDAAGGPARLIRLPEQAQGYATTLADPAILAALGQAGQVGRARGPLRLHVTVPAYVAGACVVFRAAMGPP